MVRWCRRNYAATCDCVYCERERERRRGESEGVTSVLDNEEDRNGNV
jgi:hypothetical protein